MRYLAFSIALVVAMSASAQEKQTARPQIGKPVEAAQALMKQQKFKEALAKLKEADAVPGKSPYEIYIVEATRAVAELDAGDKAGAMQALDAVLATGVLPPAEISKRVAALTQLAFQVPDYAKLALYAERYYKEGGADPEPRRLLAQAYYQEGDYAAAAKTIRAVLDAAARAKEPANEELLLALASSEYKLHDDAAYGDALEKLVRVDPKPEYWASLLGIIGRKPGFARRLALDLDRLMVVTGAMAGPRYVEAAERALEAGLPGDATSFLDRGTEAGALGKGAGAEREKRLADMAARQSSEDQKTLPQLAREAEAAPDGQKLVKLGEAYLSYGRNAEAIAAFQRGIAKGGLQNPADAKLHLGIAELRASDKEKVKAVLGGVTGNDGVADLARLWLVAGGVK